LRNAVVYVSVMGSEGEQQLAMRGLKHATGFLQARVAARLQIRFTPTLTFKKDDSVKKSIEMTRLIDETLAADRSRFSTDSAPEEGAQDESEDSALPDSP